MPQLDPRVGGEGKGGEGAVAGKRKQLVEMGKKPKSRKQREHQVPKGNQLRTMLKRELKKKKAKLQRRSQKSQQANVPKATKQTKTRNQALAAQHLRAKSLESPKKQQSPAVKSKVCHLMRPTCELRISNL
jgi:delta 1-pyrroline-5-carboxylate dehydrogenase